METTTQQQASKLPPVLTKRNRFFIGGAGAVAPISLEFFHLNDINVIQAPTAFLEALIRTNALTFFGFLLQFLILFGIGGGYVYFFQSREHNPKSLFQFGIIAPALLVSFFGGLSSSTQPSMPQSTPPQDHYQAPSLDELPPTGFRFRLIPEAHAAGELPPETKEGIGSQVLKGFSLLNKILPKDEPLTMDNVSTYLSYKTDKGMDLWRWTVFIKGDEDRLEGVKCVEYTLHRTFADPVREVCSRGIGGQAFPLTAIGYGTFTVNTVIIFKDGRREKRSHSLKFVRPPGG